MVGGNPVLDLVVKLVRLHEDFHRFSFCRNVGESIVDSVSLPPTGLEVVGVSRLSWKWRERSSVKIAERTYEERA
jgi:hypothetical protein